MNSRRNGCLDLPFSWCNGSTVRFRLDHVDIALVHSCHNTRHYYQMDWVGKRQLELTMGTLLVLWDASDKKFVSVEVQTDTSKEWDGSQQGRCLINVQQLAFDKFCALKSCLNLEDDNLLLRLLECYQATQKCQHISKETQTR